MTCPDRPHGRTNSEQANDDPGKNIESLPHSISAERVLLNSINRLENAARNVSRERGVMQRIRILLTVG
jgi:hypothetical protein